MDEPACFICDKHRDQDGSSHAAILDDGLIYAGHTLPLRSTDVLLGYLMVEPRRHVARLGDLTDEEAARIGVVVNRLSHALRELEGADHVYSFVFGDAVPHLHVHLAPRYPGTPLEQWGRGAVGLQDWEGGRRGGPAEVATVCQRLRDVVGR